MNIRFYCSVLENRCPAVIFVEGRCRVTRSLQAKCRAKSTFVLDNVGDISKSERLIFKIRYFYSVLLSSVHLCVLPSG